ncbi:MULTISPECIES: divalent-cation tolerance protein CutA [unclassified Desulfovibrio]|uniref:divalent-cation tolerance protein CutA n=1 Tax=unclassified Desulfovibrio TaxID=2593640 RepID=UPI002FD9DF38
MSYLVYVTAPHEELALDLARMLVERNLAAGVNIVPGARSIYRWRGQVHDAGECLLLAQVSREALPAFEAAVKSVHSYEVPCIVALPIEAGHEPYLRWIRENSRPPLP